MNSCRLLFLKASHLTKCTLLKQRPSAFNQTKNISNFQRPRALNVQDNQVAAVQEIFSENRALSATEWKTLRAQLIESDRNITEINIDATILGQCMPENRLTVAKSYIKYLREIGIEPNFATIGRLLKLYYYHYSAAADAIISDDDKIEIINLYNKLREKSSNFDATTCDNLCHALSLTDQWEKSLALLDSLKLYTKPFVSTYSIIISKAFSENRIELGWKLLDEMIAIQQIPKCEAFLAYFKQCGLREKQDRIALVESMLEFIGKNDISISKKVAAQIQSTFNDVGVKSKITSIQKGGRCNACSSNLKGVFLNNEEFRKLSSIFLDRVLIRKNVFLKSSPKEVESFEKFLQKTAPYDCVIDGLNVALSTGGRKTKENYANLLASVVKYFADRNKVVLVLGRKHMNAWPKEHMNFIRRNANIYLTDDLSQDDPFLLYATLKSGPNTDFFSRDLMRSHSTLLSAELKAIFRRWQQEHQYSLLHATNFGKITISEPIKYTTSAHKLNGCWHIPFIETYVSHRSESFQSVDSWLCVSKI